MEQMTFISACRKFFGIKDGQTLQQFASEIKELTAQDKLDLIEMFKTVGIDATKTS